MSETTELRYFEKLPSCAECGKASSGVLRGSRNESYGHHCQGCANRRLKASERERLKAAKRPALEASTS